DPKVTALAAEALVERIGSQYGTGRYFVALPHRRPAFDVYVGLQQALSADVDIRLDDAEFADSGAGPDNGIGVHAGRGRHHSRRVDGHEFVLSRLDATCAPPRTSSIKTGQRNQRDSVAPSLRSVGLGCHSSIPF